MVDKSAEKRYFELLRAYINHPGEKLLMEAAELGRELVLADLQPEDIVEVHEAALSRLAQENPDWTLVDIGSVTTTVMMELLMAYGLAFRERSEARQRAEEALRESEALLRQVLDTSPNLISLKDRAGAYVLVNQTIADFYGVPPEEMVGLTDLDLVEQDRISVESAEQLIAYDVEVLESKQVKFVPETSLVLPNGLVRWFQVTKLPFVRRRDWKGTEDCVLTVAVDITERKRAEVLMRQQERLAAVGQLAAGVALDFNNLLTTIVLYAQMLMVRPDITPHLSSGLEVILDEAQRAADLVDQILDFSRRSPMEPRPIDLRASVKRVIGVVGRTLAGDIELIIELPQREIVVNADPTRVQQALTNLMFNARDAMPEGGQICVSLSRMKIGVNETPPITEMDPGEWACITISDTGFSIPVEDLPHIFEPFFIPQAPSKRTGLELAQTHGIIRQHEGYVGVETSPDGGITFRIYLPVCDLQSGDQLEAAEVVTSRRGGEETILLVEDEDRIRLLGGNELRSLGYRVLTAVNGEEGLEIYRSTPTVDLVVTDLMMPEMDGWTLVKTLRAMTPDLKAVAITGYISQEGMRRLRREGFADVVHKPFDVDTLAMVVRRVLDTEKSKSGE